MVSPNNKQPALLVATIDNFPLKRAEIFNYFVRLARVIQVCLIGAVDKNLRVSGLSLQKNILLCPLLVCSFARFRVAFVWRKMVEGALVRCDQSQKQHQQQQQQQRALFRGDALFCKRATIYL